MSAKEMSLSKLYQGKLSNPLDEDLEFEKDPDDVEPASENPPSELIHISNLQRPYTQSNLKGLLSQFGRVTDLWINPIRTHALAKVASEADAKNIRSALYNAIWPKTGRKLKIEFVDPEREQEVKQALEQDVVVRPPVDEKPNRFRKNLREDLNLTGKRIDGKKFGEPRLRNLEYRKDLYAEEALSSLNRIFKMTTALPRIYYKPVDEETVNIIIK